MRAEPISVDEKSQALERVLRSRTFRRSDQLRSFLRYICDAEFEGRTHELNEYALGVSVLGRPADYSPTEDSCVRSRAYELRNKLKTYYTAEAPDEPITIQIDKGAYVPRFERTQRSTANERLMTPTDRELLSLPDATSEHAVTPPDDRAPSLASPASTFATRPALASESIEDAAPAPAPPRKTHHYWLLSRNGATLASCILLSLVSACMLWLARTSKPAAGRFDEQEWTPEMEWLWRPFLSNDVPLLISFEVRLFFYAPSTGLVVRDFQTNQVSDLGASKPLAEFRERLGIDELQENFDYADSGAVHAAFLLGRRLASERRDVGMKHASALGWEDIWNSNIVFLGKPNLNPSIRYLLNGRDFIEDSLGLIRNLHPINGEPPEYRSAATHGTGEKYALITVIPGPQPGRHIMILGGSGSELMWALAEGVTSPTRLREIVSHLRVSRDEHPTSYQVVIQATFEANVPVKIRYVTHRLGTGAW